MTEYVEYDFDGTYFNKWVTKEREGASGKFEIHKEVVTDRREIGPAIQNIVQQYLENKISADELGEALRGACKI
jgi:hypothetical protein